MPLFQQSVLNKYLGELNKEDVSKAWHIFKGHFHDTHKQHNILGAKEEQYQEGFLSELFGGVFGYTLYPQPQYNLKTEHKNEKDSKKADGAIFKGENVRAVIELKGTDTIDLGKVENQAFSYKNNQQGCDYVVTSNFKKLRFYVKDATDFDEFDLFTLSYPEFERMYLYLHREQLLNDIPLKLMQSSVVKEQEVTKALYKDYSIFKNRLFSNLCELNPAEDKLSLFKKTQKLLDRFLFILFAEDRGLLPPNAVVDIIKDFQQLKDLDNYVPLYTRFKKYFGYLNTGYKHRDYEIFAYNGGLFAEDTLLDNLVIADNVLQDGMRSMSKYDFISEVDVNILGHIFEHSLNEIEEIQAELEGKAVDKSKTKRKKDGVFYTPKYITKYIVDNTVGALCIEKRRELEIIEEEYAPIHKKSNKKALNDKLDNYREWLLQLTILDPACGSGAFLNQALDFLIAEHRKVDELRANLFGDAMVLTDLDNQILENNIFGVDINEESVEIAKLSLWLRTAQKGRKLSKLNSNIKCGNSLIDDVSIAGEKAFDWNSQFKNIMEGGGFDVVIGNPPYVNSKDDMLSTEFKKYSISKFKTSAYQIDTYILFIEKSLSLINNNGSLSLIVPNAWLSNVFLANVRKFFLQNASFISLTFTPDAFKEAFVDTIIVTFKHQEQSNSTKINRLTEKGIELLQELNQNIFCSEPLYLINMFSNDATALIINKVEENTILLEELFSIARGVGLYHKRVGHTKEFIESDPFVSSYIKDQTFVPYLRGKNVHRYNVIWNNDGFVSYGKWLAEPREEKYFEGDRLVLRQIPSKKLFCTYLLENFITDQSVFIAKNEYNKIPTKYVLSILASSLMAFYFRNKFLEFDELFPKLKLSHFKKLPIKFISVEEQKHFILKADSMLDKNKELQEVKNGLTKLLQAKYEEILVSNKLADWTLLSFRDFLKELEKQKIRLSLPEQTEWLQYFETEKAKALAIKNTIDTTDAEIDKMVYKLYDLTEEEIQSVEGS